MNSSKRFFLLIIVLGILRLVNPHLVVAYDDPTHRAIADRAVDVSILSSFLRGQLGFQEGVTEKFLNTSVRDLMISGSLKEDYPVTRVLYHFHNPLQPWNQAGLTLGGQLGQSSVLWNQQSNQSSFPGAGSGSWSWQNARQQFFDALTKGAKSDREKSFADLFRSLGQGTHLLQDATVPAHVRNDQHLNWEVTIPLVGPVVLGDPDGYEKWAKNNLAGAQSRINLAPIAPPKSIFTVTNSGQAPSPIARLFDTDRFQGGNASILSDPALGIAEFTNGNFLSKDTIFRDFTFPQRSDLNLAIPIVKPIDTRFGRYYSKSISAVETVPHFVREGMLWRSIQTATLAPPPSSGWVLDDQVHQDYASSLLPRAVGYSASLLDYFFRGKLDVELFSDENDPSILRMRGTNGSADKLDGGTLVLYADDLKGNRSAVTALDPTTIAADPGQPISSSRFQAPNDAERFIAVYKGKLGDEVPQGGSPGGVIGKVMGGVRVEQVFRDSSRWNLRSPQGVFPLPVLAQDVQELQWGDDQNTLVGRSRVGPGEANLFYAYKINRPVDSTEIPLHSPDAPLPDQPQSNQIVDLQLLQQVQFPFGIHTGTTVNFSHTLHYSQHIFTLTWERTRTWNEVSSSYSEPPFNFVGGSVIQAASESQTFNTSFPIVLDAASMPLGHFTRYIWFPQSISYTKDGRILLLVSVLLQPPTEIATFPAFELGWDGVSPPTQIPVDPIQLNFERPEMGPALWALIDVGSGQVLAISAPADLTINHQTARPQFSTRLNNTSVTNLYKSVLAGGPSDGQIGASPSVTDVNKISCTADQLNSMTILGNIVVQDGHIRSNGNQYRPEINQIIYPPSGNTETAVKKVPGYCDNPGSGPLQLGFSKTSTKNGPGLTRLDQALRTSSDSGQEQFALLFAQRQNEDDFVKVARWFPQESRAELRDEITEEGFHFVWSNSQKAALLLSFPDDGSPSSRLVSLDGNLPTKLFPNQLLFDKFVLEPDFLYDRDDFRFYTKDTTPRQTSLPAKLAPAASGNPFGPYHVLKVP